MKRILLILSILAVAVSGVGAQNKEKRDWNDRWKAEKIAFLTDAMDLTSAEAEKFWPVYNRCDNEKRDAFKAMVNAYNALDDAINSGKGSDEIDSLLNRYIDAQNYSKDIEKKYIIEYRKILSSKKVAKLYIAEESFRRQQIHRLHRNENK